MPWSHLALLAQEDTTEKWRHSCASQLEAEQWAAHTAKDPSTGGGSSVPGPKRTLPIWLLTLQASGTSHCPPRRPADGSEARPGGREGTDGVIIFQYQSSCLFMVEELNHWMKPGSSHLLNVGPQGVVFRRCKRR